MGQVDLDAPGGGPSKLKCPVRYPCPEPPFSSFRAKWRNPFEGRRLHQTTAQARLSPRKRQRGRDFSTSLEMTKAGRRIGQMPLHYPLRMTMQRRCRSKSEYDSLLDTLPTSRCNQEWAVSSSTSIAGSSSQASSGSQVVPKRRMLSMTGNNACPFSVSVYSTLGGTSAKQ